MIRKRGIREVTDLELSELRRQLSRYLKALSGTSRGGVISHFGLDFRAGDLCVSLSGIPDLIIGIDAKARKDQKDHEECSEIALTNSCWDKIRQIVIDVAGEIIDGDEHRDSQSGRGHADERCGYQYTMKMDTPPSLRFALESYHRLVGTFGHEANHCKYERFNKWLEERLAIADILAIEVKRD